MQQQLIGNILKNAFVFDIKNWREQSLTNQGLPDSESVKRLFEAIKSQGIRDYLLKVVCPAFALSTRAVRSRYAL
jgi:hypothetical protein